MDAHPYKGSALEALYLHGTSYCIRPWAVKQVMTYHLGQYSTIQGTQADIDRRLAAMGLAVKGGRDE